MSTSIVWLRRNLRLDDNRVLVRAVQESDHVIPVYFWDTDHLSNQCANRLGFILESAKELTTTFDSAGSRLLIRCGNVAAELVKLVKETGATTVHIDRNYEAYEIKRDQDCKKAIAELGATLIEIKENVLFDSGEVKTKEGKPYTVFTPFKKSVWERITTESVETITPKDLKPAKNISSFESHSLPDLAVLDRSTLSPERIQFGGSNEAETRWVIFKETGIKNYKAHRDILAMSVGTSKLSPHLKYGTISIRKLAREALALSQDTDSAEGANTYINELLWREFYYNILMSFPQVEHSAFQKKYDGIRWQHNDIYLEAWKAGKTGVPIIDAAMRELHETGWMHNRARMIVASFLTKDLLINWQEGELHFMSWLTDGDIAQNNGGWQWSASTGTDAQPYYRIFNPYLQSKRFDPDGEYIKRYVPELKNLPIKFLHEPHLMTPLDQASYGCRIGEDYPFPIVDHYVQREKAKAMFEALKERL